MPAHAQTASARTDFELDRARHTIRFTRIFDAPRATVFEAWTNPEHVACWWDPDGVKLSLCEIDLRVGGTFKFATKNHLDRPFCGTYREIAPPDLLVFEALGSTGRVMLHDVGGRTHLTVEIVCQTDDQFEQFVQMGVATGTAQTLDNLVTYLHRA